MEFICNADLLDTVGAMDYTFNRSSMAQVGHPGEDPPFESNKSSTQDRKPSRPAGESVYNSVICSHPFAASPTRNTKCSSPRPHRGPAEKQLSGSEHCVIPSQSPSLSDSCPLLHHKVVIKTTNDNEAGSSFLSMKLDPSSVLSDNLPVVKNGVVLQAPDGCRLGVDGEKKATTTETETQSMLACKQPMQVHQCNTITTFCRDAGSREGCVHPPQSKCVCKTAGNVGGLEDERHFTAKCDKALCYGSYVQHNLSEDTFAAYCHPQPLPAPSQLLPCLAGIEPICKVQRAVTPPPAANHLTPPRLTSSVSDTGLDAKHQLQCCSLKCSWMSSLPPFTGMQYPKHLIRDECCTNALSQARTMTHDIGTMTVHKVLRDVGVQTGRTVTSHVFPQIFLADNSKSKIFCTQTAYTDRDGGKKSGDAPKSPVKEVKWDAEGMTWEVYGASVDPEELGLAIQKHLELQIKETTSRVNKMSHQNTSSTGQDRKVSCQRKSIRMMLSIRAPACCKRSTTAAD
ncbi:uncharacterized protein si:dkey-191g9.7 isoform X2 [Melanotaenia boesemani]|uniref:uncharacterized protein si:dkey-191g9.7 isoform X2 n=1 Tax=Melanotaenia boesemani TaxID=1250792 RepID=UPI001C03AD35|nr:uncharacterized protein si:dkey-191g9.7 isoform X2 [Melanotaenia boesemani]